MLMVPLTLILKYSMKVFNFKKFHENLSVLFILVQQGVYWSEVYRNINSVEYSCRNNDALNAVLVICISTFL